MAGLPKWPMQVPELFVLFVPSGHVVFDHVMFPSTVALVMFAPNRLAPLKFAPLSVALVMLARKKFTHVRLVPFSVALVKFALLKFESERLAPLKVLAVKSEPFPVWAVSVIPLYTQPGKAWFD